MDKTLVMEAVKSIENTAATLTKTLVKEGLTIDEVDKTMDEINRLLTHAKTLRDLGARR